MNKHIQMVADAYAFGYGKSTESASASRTGYIAGAMYMADEIVKDIASLRDNYMRQLQVEGRPSEGFAFIAGKVEAANMILEILKKYK